jgi:hypothetical protein
VIDLSDEEEKVSAPKKHPMIKRNSQINNPEASAPSFPKMP